MMLIATDFPPDLKATTHPFVLHQKHWRAVLVFLVGLSTYFILFHHIGVRDFWSSHEARSAMDATSILEGESLLAPKLFDGARELQKPPLYYWLVAGISWLRNTNPDTISVRLPSAISAAMILFMVSGFFLIRKRKLEALLAFLFLLSCLHFPWAARIGRTDMVLTFLITLSVLSATLAKTAQGTPRICLYLLSHIGLLLAILCKGLVGLALAPAIIMVSIFFDDSGSPLLQKPMRILKQPETIVLFTGWLLVLVISGLVFYWIDQASDGEFLKTFFGYHHLTRALGNGELRSHPVWYYFYLFTIDFFPWSPLFAVCLCSLIKIKNLSSEARLGLTWFGTVFLLLSLASYKRSDYLLPAYPGAAIFLAGVSSRYLQKMQPQWHISLIHLTPTAFLAITSLAWIGYLDFYLPILEPHRETKSFAERIRKETREELVFFNIEAHSLAFHTGKPLRTIVGEQNLAQHLQDRQHCFLITTPNELELLSHSLRGWKQAILLDRPPGQTQGLSKPFIVLKAWRDNLAASQGQNTGND